MNLDELRVFWGALPDGIRLEHYFASDYSEVMRAERRIAELEAQLCAAKHDRTLAVEGLSAVVQRAAKREWNDDQIHSAYDHVTVFQAKMKEQGGQVS